MTAEKFLTKSGKILIFPAGSYPADCRHKTMNAAIRFLSRLILRCLLHNTSHGCIFILGMHRSGTSCLAGMLKEYGLYLGNVSDSNPHNLKGNQEGYSVSINEALLQANGGNWYAPVQIKRIPWRLQFQIERFCIQMAVDLLRRKKESWGLKDPRMLFCWPAWQKDHIRFAGTFRHPLSVHDSLEKRSGGAVEADWVELWYQYNVVLVNMYNENPFPIVNFDWEPDRYRRAVENIARGFNLEVSKDVFFDEKLRHERKMENITAPKYGDLYSQLVDIAEKEEKKLRVAHPPLSQ